MVHEATLHRTIQNEVYITTVKHCRVHVKPKFILRLCKITE